MERKKKIFVIVIILVVLAIGGVMIYFENQGDYADLDVLEEADGEFLTNEVVNSVESESENLNEVVDNGEMIAVHITGEVKKTGIVYLKKGARIDDAIKEAGGATKNANLDKVNLAYVLSDGQKIYIPNKNDKDAEIKYIISDSGENIVVDEGNKGSSGNLGNSGNVKGVSEKVNINTAGMEELESLKGIGPSLAQRIIEYRESNGGFKKIEELQEVKGIGDSKFSNIKDSVCI